MLDVATEALISLADAARLIPPARSGRRTHISTIVRWITTGAAAPDSQRVRLEAVRLGDRWFTSREALQRFADRLTPQIHNPSPPTSSTPTSRRRASERAARELEQLGI